MGIGVGVSIHYVGTGVGAGTHQASHIGQHLQVGGTLKGGVIGIYGGVNAKNTTYVGGIQKRYCVVCYASGANADAGPHRHLHR